MDRYSTPMPSSRSDAATRLEAVRARIAAAAQRANRAAEDITLIAVSKTHPASAVAELAECGQRHFGENYLQEAVEKIAQLRELPLVWHFVGHLQSNKTRAVAENFAWVHTVDRLKTAQRLSEQRPFHAPALQVLVQLRLGEEAGKSGVEPAALPALLAGIAALPRLQLRGLMALPPAEREESAQRHWFAKLRELFEQARLDHPQLDTLSMGMSGDLEAAVLEGSTQLRIGTALFGDRLQSTA